MSTTTIARTKASAQDVFWENVRTIAYALALAMAIRFVFVQPFRIPSGSMQPTLMVGDYIVVTKWSYGYSRYSITPLEFLAGDGRVFGSKPERGDIVVFRPDTQPDKDFVKRLVGLPGDVVQMRQGVLHINGQPVQREALEPILFEDNDRMVSQIARYRETLPNGKSYITFDRAEGLELDDTPPFRVPEGRYFMMGDDRDNSQDSRTSAVGMVPYDHLVGKSHFVLASWDYGVRVWLPWTLLTELRPGRFFKATE